MYSMPIVLDRNVVAPTFEGAATFLRQQPRGPYTSLVVRKGRSILSWEAHVTRLAESVQLLQANGIFPVTFPPPLEERCSQIAQLVLPSLQQAIRYISKDERSLHEDISAVVLLASQAGVPHAVIHAATFSWPAGKLTAPSEALLFPTGSRSLAAAKDSQWATDRLPLEAAVAARNDGILCSGDGRLLEGFVTNAFIVKDGGVVQTASPRQDRVLDGIMRRQVVCLCKSLSLPVLESAPLMAERHQWEEAFLTNCRRMIQPISRMTLAHGDRDMQWTAEFTCSGRVTNELYHALLASSADDALDLNV